MTGCTVFQASASAYFIEVWAAKTETNVTMHTVPFSVFAISLSLLAFTNVWYGLAVGYKPLKFGPKVILMMKLYVFVLAVFTVIKLIIQAKALGSDPFAAATAKSMDTVWMMLAVVFPTGKAIYFRVRYRNRMESLTWNIDLSMGKLVFHNFKK